MAKIRATFGPGLGYKFIMRVSRCFFRLVLLSLFTVAPHIFAEEMQNWGHWRGHNGNGGSETAQPPTKWSETENVKWKVKIPGRGSCSPVIWGEQVFVVSAVSDSPTETTSGGG